MRNLSSRSGFTIAEILVAAIVLAIGLLALETALGASIRSLAESRRSGLASSDAELRRERSAASCTSSAGTDSIAGASVVWTSTAGSGSVTSRQQTTVTARSGAREEVYDAAALCR